MIRIRRLRSDTSGAAAIEFAIAVPVLVLFIYGIFVIGLLFQANAGMQHALGEAARHATIYVEANDGPPSDDQILAKVTEKKFGLNGGTLSEPQLDKSNISSGYMTLSLTYTRPLNFLFFRLPNVTLTRSKRIYVAEASA